jgi:hypothetical protein
MPLLIIVALAADKMSSSDDDTAALFNDGDILPVLNAAEFIKLLTDEKPEEKLDPKEL